MSTINWFPGHMHKARKEIAQVMDEIDVVIEVLDARLPVSSENPMVSQLRKGTPVIKLLNKSDLADPQRTQEWAAFYNSLPDTQALIIDYSQKKLISTIPDLCNKLVPSRSNHGRQVRAMIMGIPNVGKSTMINALLGRKIAKVGNEPAVTKGQKRFTLRNGMALSDTPGMLWPKIEDIDSGYRLAASGAIKNTAIEFEDVALYAAEFLRKAYPELLVARYKLKQLPERGDQVLEEIGRKRGGLRPGGKIDMHKASEILLNELRGGQLGQITYETVEEWLLKWEQQRLEAERLEQEREAQEGLEAESQSDRPAQRNKGK
ncbi:ribosome biogenesis GTPase YlqF [Amphritea pacifica]|uniref:ribosome biogenesis GTPase YlqF n=1 Tax=Amphritea pacifica TaxID=2811233 RepID=UPI001962B082|nr:ribosome biogenesis GTPase YlqF [Amphritea pacifica]MBN1007820.1 ribosome biogenesis GTPase YlqF [Amphritea pacifica]